MTPTQFRASRRRLGYTQVELARAFDVGARYIQKLEAGEQPITRRLALAMAGLLAQERDHDDQNR